MGVHPGLRKFMRDGRGFDHGGGIIRKFFALRIANARPVFEMKEIFHRARLRPNWLLRIWLIGSGIFFITLSMLQLPETLGKLGVIDSPAAQQPATPKPAAQQPAK